MKKFPKVFSDLLNLVANVILSAHTTFCSNQLFSVVFFGLQPFVGSLTGRRSEATQSRALNLGERSKNPLSVIVRNTLILNVDYWSQ